MEAYTFRATSVEFIFTQLGFEKKEEEHSHGRQRV
jgi:hypothetical protein